MRIAIAVLLAVIASACARPAAESFALALDKHARIFRATTTDGKDAVIVASHRTLLYCEDTGDDVFCGQFADFNEHAKPAAPAPAPAPPTAPPPVAAPPTAPPAAAPTERQEAKPHDAKPQAPPPATPAKR